MGVLRWTLSAYTERMLVCVKGSGHARNGRKEVSTWLTILFYIIITGLVGIMDRHNPLILQPLALALCPFVVLP